MKKRINSILQVILVCSFFMIANFSCLDKIELEAPSGLSNNLVIQGRVILGNPSRVEVFAERLFDFSSQSRLKIGIKEVILMDDTGNEMILEPNLSGKYITQIKKDDIVKVEVGGRYKLQVTTFNDFTYESSFDVLEPNVSPLSMGMALAEEFETNPIGDKIPVDRLEIYIDSKFEKNDLGVFWEVENTYKFTDLNKNICYVTHNANVNRLPFLDLNKLLSSEITNFPLIRIGIDFRMSEGMYFTVRQYSLSNEATEYWEKVSFLIERKGGLFDDPIGLINSNFANINDPDELVYGFFFATQEEVAHMKVPADLVGMWDSFCPSPNLSGECDICCDCLLIAGSSIIKPDYWID